MKLPVYNLQGTKVKDIALNPAIFNIKTKAWIIQEAVVAQQANRRVNIAHVKDRSEVRGGGRKPWRQKGTGRARHGSIRSPLWRGGGTTFGPRNIQNFKKKINKKVKRQALLMCLSEKANDKTITILDKLEFPEIKTKHLVNLLKTLNISDKKILISLPKKDDKIIKSSNSLQKIKLIAADSLNVVDVLWADIILTPEEGIKKIENTYGNIRQTEKKN